MEIMKESKIVSVLSTQEKVERLIGDLQGTPEKQIEIERNTRDQNKNGEWGKQRKYRITASKCGEIFKMRDSTNNSRLIKDLLDPPDLSSIPYVQRGLDLEPEVRRKYTLETGREVELCGLFVSVENGVLAASPDGVVGDDRIIEIYCPTVPLREIPKRKGPGPALVYDKNNELTINKKSNHYYQIIMQLYVTNRQYCDFVVYYEGSDTVDPQLWHEIIEKTEETDKLWAKMSEKLIRFYTQDLAPQIVSPWDPPRQPEYRDNAIKKAEDAKVAKEKKNLKNKASDDNSNKRNKYPRVENWWN